MKILDFKRSRIGIIAEFHGILSKFTNQGERLVVKKKTIRVFLDTGLSGDLLF
jgi:hypothetical protein